MELDLNLIFVSILFISGSDLFLEKPIHPYLAGLFRALSTQKQLNKFDFEEKIPGITSFYDL